MALKSTEEGKDGGDSSEKGIYFEDIDDEDFQEAEKDYNKVPDEETKTDQQNNERKSFRDKIRNGMAMKTFVSSAFDKGIKAVYNLKDNVTHFDSMMFSGQEKKAAQKRLSEDLTS